MDVFPQASTSECSLCRSNNLLYNIFHESLLGSTLSTAGRKVICPCSAAAARPQMCDYALRTATLTSSKNGSTVHVFNDLWLLAEQWWD